MTKNSKQKNVPDGWRVERYDQIFDVVSKVKGLKKTEYCEFGKFSVFDQGQGYISAYSSNENIVNSNFPVILFGDHTRVVKYINQKYIVGNDGIKLLKNKEIVDSKFLYYLLIFKDVPNTGYNRHFKYLKDEYLFPKSLEEQKKIAEVLGTVDEDIERTDGVIKRAERLKKGLMHKLFTLGIGHTKFKKTKLGKIPEDWEVVKLGNLFDKIVGGGTPARKESVYWNGNIPWMTVKDMDDRKYIYSVQEYITSEGLKNSSSNVVAENNIITSTRMGVGRVYINKTPIAINQDLKGLIVESEFRLEYIYWSLKFIANKLEKISTGSTVKGIKIDDFKNVDIVITSNEKEQQKIAEILSAVDEKIFVNKKLKEKLTRLKKGLMQDLLSGKIRVGV